MRQSQEDRSPPSVKKNKGTQGPVISYAKMNSAILVGAAQLLSPVQRCRGWWGGRRGPGRCRAQWGPASSSSWPSGRRRGHTSTHTETNVVFWIHDISVWIRFSAYTFWRYIYIIFQIQKIQKKSQKKYLGIKVFLTIFAFW